MAFEKTIQDVVTTLRNAQQRDRKCSLLIGAGCSVKAGIPAASGIVERIKEKNRRAWDSADPKTYPKCMAKLPPGERRALIADYVDRARINWAHICIAQLMRLGFVDRVLTTNFDLLASKACNLLGVFPAVYDFAASQLYDPAGIPDQAIINLHGQRTGFVLMNTEEECKRHTKLLAPVFQDAGAGRPWIVVGYSGENDPVFDHLAKVPCFDFSLYWIGYRDNPPARRVQERLLQDEKYAFYVSGYDADDFFAIVTQQLGCFPPDFVGRPFSYLDGLLDMVTPYSLPGQAAEIDVRLPAREQIRAAQKRYETPAVGLEVKRPRRKPVLDVIGANRLLMAGEYEKLITAATKPGGRPAAKLAEPVSWAFVMQGTALYDQAKTKSGAEADGLLALAGEKYQAALKIKPDMHEALNNWGFALYDQAKTKSGAEADGLFALAGEKYQAALKIKPDMHEALNNWGLALSAQAKTKSGAEADGLLALAGEKYQAALKIKPDEHEALYNWGLALSDQAKTKSGAEADGLRAQAAEKLEAARRLRAQRATAVGQG